MTAASATATDDAAVLWLATLQRAVGRASHDLKDALNGVSVNLEVIRSRAGRADAHASAVAPFAEAAGQQLERLANLIEAVLALGRPEREPVDVALTLRRVATVCGASASNADATVDVREADGGILGSTTTKVRGEIVRLAITAALLEAVTGAGTDRHTRATAVLCTIGGDEANVLVTIGAEGRRTRMPDGVAELARAAGVRWTEGPQDLSLAFPRV